MTEKNTSNIQKAEWWEELLSAQKVIQDTFPECVLVGGTATAMHCDHRLSYDGDHVMKDLNEKFDLVLQELEFQSGWVTNRIKRPVMILGSFDGIETGIRQLIRSKPLETVIVKGIRIPTMEEMARIKGYLILRRNAVRDYIDFCALADKLKNDRLMAAFEQFDAIYSQDNSETALRQLCKQLAEPLPYDLRDVSLNDYKGLTAPYTDWRYLENRCKEISDLFVDKLLFK